MIRKSDEIQYRLVHNICHYFYTRNNGTIAYDELYAEALYGYAKARAYFDSSHNVKFTTYAYRTISNVLKNYCVNEQKHINNTVEIIEEISPIYTPPEDFLEGMYNSCTELTKTLIKLALRGVGGNEYRKNCLQSKLRTKLKEYGYNSDEINQSFDEIRMYLDTPQ